MSGQEIEERIAIMIHDGKLQPEEAERLARKIAAGKYEEPEQMELI